MSMHGKVVVVTGSNVGIGLETAVGVAALGATTVLACRNQAKAEAAAREVTQRTWNDDVHVVPLDLADLASVRKAAEDDPHPLGPPRRPRQQRRGHVVAARGDRPGVRVHLRGQPPRPLLPDQPPARPPARRRPVADRQRHLGRPPLRPAGHALRRPAEREGLRRHGGLLPLQAGQRPLHPPAGAAARGHRRHRQRGAPRPGAQRVRHGRRPDRVHGLRPAAGPALRDQPPARREDVPLPGDVTRRRDQDRHVLGPLQAGSYEPPGPRRRGGGAAVGRERAAARRRPGSRR